ncbi:cytochrome P450 6A1 [Xylariaceae sp. FL0662B]|nr:cytochrome P450 6A1 [Xylariaceae sp. FL0662B]
MHSYTYLSYHYCPLRSANKRIELQHTYTLTIIYLPIQKMTAVVETIFNPPSWPSSIWVLLLSSLVLLLFRVFRRPSLPANAPKWWKTGDWPILGALRFYKDRRDFYTEAVRDSPTGSFSFYVGKKQIVGLSGPEGRKFFFESRDLNFSAGFAELLTGQPAQVAEMDNFSAFFTKNIIALLKRENLAKLLGPLTSDTRRSCEALAAAPTCRADPKWKVTAPFESLYGLVYQLTMRTVGAHEVAEDPALLRRTLSIFEGFEASDSVAHVFLPWLPTPNHLARLYNGARLALVFRRIINARRAEGKRRDDALQFLIDGGAGMRDIIGFQIGALYAGQLNSGVNAAWVHVFLALHPAWKARVRDEVDAAIARNRRSPSQSAADVLGSLSVEAWETEFGLVDLCLRESIRLCLPGTSFRKNLSGRDVPIGDSGEVVPAGAFAAYLIDDALLNPAFYDDPTRFDPDRYLEGRAEDRKAPHAYPGWGSGRHPCLGMRFAKLEMALITAYFVAMFDFELSDADGNPTTEAPPPVSRNQHSAKKPAKPVYFRYRPRVC